VKSAVNAPLQIPAGEEGEQELDAGEREGNSGMMEGEAAIRKEALSSSREHYSLLSSMLLRYAKGENGVS